MTTQQFTVQSPQAIAEAPDGGAAAAILAAGIGCFFVGLFATLGDAFEPVKNFFNFYKPTGALSGVTTIAIAIWLVVWYVLHRLWSPKSVSVGKVSAISFVLLLGGLLLTFPPFMDFLQGK